MTKLLVRYSVAVMTTLLGLAILWQFRVAVVYVLISVTLAATLRPLVTRLIGRTFWERVGWILLYLIALGISGYLLFLVGKVALVEIQQLATTISTQDEWTLPSWLQGSMFQEMLSARLLPPSTLFQLAAFGQVNSVLPAILGFTQSLASMVSGALIIVFMSFYWILNKNHFERLWLSLLPSGQRKQAREIWQTIEPDLGVYIRSQIAINILAGVLLGLGYWIIGSPYPMLLALIGAFIFAIPFIGVAIAAILPLVMGLVTGMQSTQLIVLYTLAVMVVLGILVKPRLFYRRWDNPILTLILLVALSDAFGLIGIIVAPPLSAILVIFWSLLVTQRTSSEEIAQVSDIKQRQESLWAVIRSMDEPPPPQITSTMERLDRLIEKAEPVLQAASQEPPANPSLPGIPASDQE